MSPIDPAELRTFVDQLVNALQATILVAENLERAVVASSHDARTIACGLARASDVLKRLHANIGTGEQK
jgi:hypothetical protein